MTTGALGIILDSFFTPGSAGGVGFSIFNSLLGEGGMSMVVESVEGLSNISVGAVSFLLNSSMTIWAVSSSIFLDVSATLRPKDSKVLITSFASNPFFLANSRGLNLLIISLFYILR
ncbi:MAG: hypothetical protein DDT23_01272 [candidate division WS2 bacterium]|nr:hypothetical protein [Candidatus Lithacetigena glycinireducens]